VGESVIGYDPVVRLLSVALVAEGHVLLEGVPGVAKTMLVRRFSSALDLTFKRIQFTPDMLPSDIVGTVILNPLSQGFEYRRGPVFANVILADELNRAPAKVQSALLEAMAAADHSVPELRVDGGGSENPWLMQFQADVLGTVVDVASVKETTALGAGYVAGLGVGLWSDRSELRGHRRSARRYEPSMGTGERDGLYARWRQAVERARGWAAESSG
jgi:hypothetical protein